MIRQAVLLLAPTLLAAQTGRITGTVTDSSAVPVVGAHVLLASTGLSAESGEGGRFTIAGVPAGAWALKVFRLGYKPRDLSVVVSAGQDQTVAIRLERAAVQLTSVVVAASRRVQKITEAPATITSLDTSDIAGLAGNSYLPALRGAKGLEFQQTGVLTSFVNARGFNSAYNTRMLNIEDGRIAVLLSSLPVGGSTTIPKLDVAGVEVLVGPGSALYGPDASNGVIVVNSKDPRQFPGWVAEVSGGTRSYYDAQARYAAVRGQLAFKVAGEYQAADDWHDALTYAAVTPGGPVIAEVGRDFHTDVARASGALAWYTPGARLQLTVGVSKRNGLQLFGPGRLQLENFGYRDYQLQYTGARWFAQVYHTNAAGPDVMNLGAFSQNSARYTALPFDSLKALSMIPGDHRLYAAEVQHNFLLGTLGRTGVGAIDDAHLIWGVQFRHERNSSYLRNLVDRETGVADEVEQKGVYAQLESPLAPRVRFVTAVRYDKHDRWPAQVSPKAGVLFDVASDQTLRLTYNRAFKSPFIHQTDFYQPNAVPGAGFFGNAHGFDIRNSAGALVRSIAPLTPETNDTWELGYKGSIAGRLYVDVTGYHSRFSNFLSGGVVIATPFAPGAAATTAFDHATGAPMTDDTGNPQTVLSFFNLGEASITGLDAGLRYYFGNRVVASANASFLKLDTIKIKPTDPQDVTAMNSSSARISLGVQFTDVPVRVNHGWSLRYVNGYDYRFGVHYGRVPPYGALDLNLSHRLRGSRTTLTLQVQNAFACVGGTSTPPATGLSATARATYTPGRKCGFGQPHQEMLNVPLMGAMAFAGVRWEGR